MGMQQGVRPGMPMEQDSQMVKMLSAFYICCISPVSLHCVFEQDTFILA